MPGNIKTGGFIEKQLAVSLLKALNEGKVSTARASNIGQYMLSAFPELTIRLSGKDLVKKLLEDLPEFALTLTKELQQLEARHDREQVAIVQARLKQFITQKIDGA